MVFSPASSCKRQPYNCFLMHKKKKISEPPKLRNTCMSVGYVKNNWPNTSDGAEERRIYRLQLATEMKLQVLNDIATEVKRRNQYKADKQCAIRQKKIQIAIQDDKLKSILEKKELEIRSLKSALALLRNTSSLCKPVSQMSNCMSHKTRRSTFTKDKSAKHKGIGLYRKYDRLRSSPTPNNISAYSLYGCGAQSYLFNHGNYAISNCRTKQNKHLLNVKKAHRGTNEKDIRENNTTCKENSYNIEKSVKSSIGDCNMISSNTTKGTFMKKTRKIKSPHHSSSSTTIKTPFDYNAHSDLQNNNYNNNKQCLRQLLSNWKHNYNDESSSKDWLAPARYSINTLHRTSLTNNQNNAIQL